VASFAGDRRGFDTTAGRSADLAADGTVLASAGTEPASWPDGLIGPRAGRAPEGHYGSGLGDARDARVTRVCTRITETYASTG